MKEKDLWQMKEILADLKTLVVDIGWKAEAAKVAVDSLWDLVSKYEKKEGVES